tara:strand:+ start:429 stop:614 length:186 start_codon:yes stop_codon:yes gene_type:complete
MIIKLGYLEIFCATGVILMIEKIILLELPMYLIINREIHGDTGKHLKKKHIGNILKKKRTQ